MTAEASGASNLRAVGFLMASNVVFVAMELIAKQLVAEEGMSPLQVLWVRAVVTLVLLPLVLRRSPLALARTADPVKQGLRSLLLLGAGSAFFFSLQEVPLADAVAIVFVSPLFMTAIAFFVLKETVGWRRWVACLVGFAGAMLIIQPGLGVRHWMYMLPLFDALFSAVYVILTRIVGRRDSAWTSLYWSVMATAVALTLAQPFVWAWPSGGQWLLLAGITVTGLVAHFCHIRAFAEGEASLMAPLTYIHVVFTTAAAYLVFGTLPDWLAGAGIVAIVGAGLYILHRETIRRGRPRPIPPPGSEGTVPPS